MNLSVQKKIYAIVVTYNGQKWVSKCFDSLLQSTVPLNVIVVDNNSSDNTVALIEAGYPSVDVIRCHENQGFGKANNIGIKKAMSLGADYVFLLNQDAWIYPETVSILMEALELQPEYYIVSPIHTDGTGLKLDLAFSTYLGPQSCPDLVSDHILQNPLKKVYPVSFVNAAVWLLSRICIERIGYFDTAFPHYGEDDNYIHRMAYHGGKLGICPTARACHDRPQQVTDFRKLPFQQRFYRQKVASLITLMNINEPFGSCLARFGKDRIEAFSSSLFRGNWKGAYAEIKAAGSVLMMMRVISERRKENKRQARPLL